MWGLYMQRVLNYTPNEPYVTIQNLTTCVDLSVYVVVILFFLSQVILFLFSFVIGMVMYANEDETKQEKYKLPEKN